MIHEDALRVELSVKAPDYCFRMGGQRIFFVEAKKPAVNIKDDTATGKFLVMVVNVWTDFRSQAMLDS